MLHSVAWKIARSEGGVAARRSLMAASLAMATFLTTSMPGGCRLRDAHAPVTLGASPDDEAVPLQPVEQRN